MQGIMDTHTFLWWAKGLNPQSQQSQLSQPARQFCADPQNTLLLSVASIWEIQIKVQTGRMVLHSPLEKIVRDQVTQNGLIVLPITKEHVYGLDALPPIHRDPFDRILIAQTNHEGAVLLTRDTIIPQYPVQTLW